MWCGSNDLCNARDKICQITSDTLISQFFLSYLRNGNGIALKNKNAALLQKGCHHIVTISTYDFE